MSYFAYHRVSHKTQRLDRGLIEIEAFCKSRGITLAHPVYTDKQTGKNFNRPRYTVLKEDVLRENQDVLILSELDRLGRNKREILKELEFYRDRGIRVMILELPTTLVDIDIADPLGKLIFETIQNMVIELYACLAQAEVEKKDKRQREGIDAMKARGDWDRYGRPKACAWDKFVAMYQRVERGEIRPSVAAKELGMSVPTFYRYKDKYKTEKAG